MIVPLSLLPSVYPILDSAALREVCAAPLEAAEALLEAGARILQFRHKEQFDRLTFETAERMNALCQAAGAAFVINDRADIALLLECGVHVGQDDLPPTAARSLLGSSVLIGYSTHNALQLEQADATEPVDYLAIGPIFETASKEKPDPMIGVEQLASLRTLTRKPLVAIGGITIENAAAVYAAGADSIAVIRGLFPKGADRITIRKLMETWQQTAQQPKPAIVRA